MFPFVRPVSCWDLDRAESLDISHQDLLLSCFPCVFNSSHMYFLRAQQVVKVKAVWNWMVIFYFVLRLRLECFSIVRIVVCCQTRDILLLELPSSIIQQTVSSPLPRRHSHLTTLSRCPPHTGSWPAQFLLGFPPLFFDMKSSTGIWHFYRMIQSVFPWWIIRVWTLRIFPFWHSSPMFSPTTSRGARLWARWNHGTSH